MKFVITSSSVYLSTNDRTTGMTSYPLQSSSTITTFLLDTGQIPCMGFEPRQNPSSLEMVNEFTKRMESTTKEAKSMIHKV